MTGTQDPTTIRAAAERTARIVLISGLAPVIPGAGFVIWAVGFSVHPHRVALACIVAAAAVAISVSYSLLVYRLRMKQASRRWPDNDSYQD